MNQINTAQAFTQFGGGYMQECAEELRCNHPADLNQVVASLTIAMFDEVLASLRSALTLR